MLSTSCSAPSLIMVAVEPSSVLISILEKSKSLKAAEAWAQKCSNPYTYWMPKSLRYFCKVEYLATSLVSALLNSPWSFLSSLERHTFSSSAKMKRFAWGEHHSSSSFTLASSVATFLLVGKQILVTLWCSCCYPSNTSQNQPVGPHNLHTLTQEF